MAELGEAISYNQEKSPSIHGFGKWLQNVNTHRYKRFIFSDNSCVGIVLFLRFYRFWKHFPPSHGNTDVRSHLRAVKLALKFGERLPMSSVPVESVMVRQVKHL